MNAELLIPAEVVRACLDTPSDRVWRDFVRCFHPVIASGIVRVVRQQSVHVEPSLIDDLIQDTYLKLCKDKCRLLREFRPQCEDSICAFVKVIAINIARDYMTAQKTKKRGVGLIEEGSDAEGVTSPDCMEQELLLSEVAGRLEQLVDNRRDLEIFWMHYRQGFSAREIAELPGLGLTAKGVESCIFRLTKQLRESVDPKVLLIIQEHEMKRRRNPVRGGR